MMRNLVDPVQLPETNLLPSMFHKSSILLSSKLSKIVFLFTSRRRCFKRELGMLSRFVRAIVLLARNGGDR